MLSWPSRELYHFLNLFLYFEVIVVVFSFTVILLHRIRLNVSKKNNQKHKENISNFLTGMMRENKTIQQPFPMVLFLETLEAYDRKIKGIQWETLKKTLATQFLLPKARKWFKSLFWVKRNFAARVFSLAPQNEDETYILALIDDPSFLVRCFAATAAIKIESQKGVLKILEKMQQEPGYENYYYSDMFSQGSQQIFQWIIEFANTYPKLRLQCLSVLKLKTSSIPPSFLNPDLNASDLKTKIAALEILVRNPSLGSVKIFASCFKDLNERIRVLGACGLGNFSTQESLSLLKNGYLDPSPLVRLECARSLKKLGKTNLLCDEELIEYIKEFG